MLCSKCGYELAENDVFCSKCGTPVNNKSNSGVQTFHLKCQDCGGTMRTNEDGSIIFCQFCGSKRLIVESDNVKIEQIRNKAFVDVESEKIQSQKELEFAKINHQKFVEKVAIIGGPIMFLVLILLLFIIN